MNTDQLITVKELSQRLNVPVSWIYQRTRLGQEAIPHVKMGKYVRFHLVEVVEFFKNNPLLDRYNKRLANRGNYGTIRPLLDIV